MLLRKYKINQKQMVITKNDDGTLFSVTDENGVPAQTSPPDAVMLTDEDKKFRSPTKYASDDTFLLTKHNPTCGWYWYHNRWYWICS